MPRVTKNMFTVYSKNLISRISVESKSNDKIVDVHVSRYVFLEDDQRKFSIFPLLCEISPVQLIINYTYEKKSLNLLIQNSKIKFLESFDFFIFRYF